MNRCQSPWSSRGRAARNALALALMLIAASGAGCPRMLMPYSQPLPKALPPSPTLVQVMDVINANSARVQSLDSNQASISSTGSPSIRATFVFQREKRFRLTGESFFGQELDFGSNDEQFWFWVKRNTPPDYYFCRHDQFATSAAKETLPFEPQWLPQALGLVTFDSSEQHQGPFPVQSDRLQIRSNPTTPGAGPRVTVIDASRGIVLEEHRYDAQGRLVASAKLSRHAQDANSQAILPRRIEMQWPLAKFSVTLDLPDLQVNRLGPEAQANFIPPALPGYQRIDLADPNLKPAMAPAPNGIPTAVRPRSANLLLK